MKYISLINLLFLVFCSCNKQNNVEKIVDFFPVVDSLKAEIIQIPPVAMSPFNMFETREKVIMFNDRKDTVFDVFSLPDWKWLYSGGIKGEGPNDFFMLDRRLFIPTNRGFKTFFMANRYLKEVEVTDRYLKVLQDNTIQLDIDQFPMNGLTQINDSIYIYWSGFGKDTEYQRYNIYTHSSETFSPYPDWTDMNLEEDKIFTYVKNITVKPDGTLFAAFYGYFKHFRIFDNNGNLKCDIALNVAPSDPDLSPSERMIYYTGYPRSTNDYIYVLCKNAKSKAIVNPELQIWKWDGTPVGVYYLDKPVMLFEISEKYKKLYAIDGDEEDKVYVYDLPL